MCASSVKDLPRLTDTQDCDVDEYVDCSYAERPFQLLRDVVEKGGGDVSALYGYCKNKLRDEKFDSAHVRNCFYDLMLTLAIRANNRDFIAMQGALLADTPTHPSRKRACRKFPHNRGR